MRTKASICMYVCVQHIYSTQCVGIFFFLKMCEGWKCYALERKNKSLSTDTFHNTSCLWCHKLMDNNTPWSNIVRSVYSAMCKEKNLRNPWEFFLFWKKNSQLLSIKQRKAAQLKFKCLVLLFSRYRWSMFHDNSNSW